MTSIQLKLIVVFFSLSIHCFSQDYKGAILDSKTQKGIPYVNIGIPIRAYGIISNESGEFSIKITSEKDTDTMLVSSIGYNTLYLTVKQFKTICDNHTSIYLKEAVYDLATTTVRPNEYETKIMGAKNAADLECMVLDNFKNKPNSEDTVARKIAKEKGLTDRSFGFEIGNKIKIDKGQETYIDKIQFKTCLEPNDTAIYRINIYSEGATLRKFLTPIGMIKVVNSQNELKEPIIIKVIGKTEVHDIDVSPQNIKVTDDFMVALECLYSSNDKMIIGAAGSFFGSTDLLYRNSVMSSWVKLPLINITFISATVTQKKKKSFWNKLFN
jgi:CarboxypepD_reg-like domain